MINYNAKRIYQRLLKSLHIAQRRIASPALTLSVALNRMVEEVVALGSQVATPIIAITKTPTTEVDNAPTEIETIAQNNVAKGNNHNKGVTKGVTNETTPQKKSTIEVIKAKIHNNIAALIVIIAIAVSCNGNININSFASNVDPEQWSRVAVIQIPNSDTLSRRDLWIYVRHQPHELRDSLNLDIITSTPDNTSIAESVTIHLNPQHNQRRGSTITTEQLYRTNVLWNQRGDYKLHILPTTLTKGVEAVGIKLIDSSLSQ